MSPLIVLLGIAMVIGAVLVVHHQMEKKRRGELDEQAQAMGLTYVIDDDGSVFQRMSDFNLFQTGRSRKIKNLITGETDEVLLAIFDYQYTTGSGKNQQTSRQTVASMESELLEIPPFTMRPENMFHRIGGMLGMQDIDFDDSPDFSRAFLLKSPFEEQVRQFFDSEILNFFADRKGVCVEAQPGKLIFYRAGKRIKPVELTGFLEDGYQVFGLFADRKKRA